MPIDIAPISTTTPVVTAQPLTCDALNVDALTIDGSGRDDSGKPPTLTLTVTPYQQGAPNRYAGESITCTTANLYAAAARVPAIGQAIGAVFAAVAAWHAYNDARRADLAVATAAHDYAQEQAKAITDVAEAALAEADAAYVAAYQARTADDAPEWLAAINARQTAEAAMATARQQAVDLIAPTAECVAVAQAALDDPANPPLASEASE